jgi:hypothetical protein
LADAATHLKRVDDGPGLSVRDRQLLRRVERARGACADAARAAGDEAFAARQPRPTATELLTLRANRFASDGGHREALRALGRLEQLAPRDGEHLVEVALGYLTCADIVAAGTQPHFLAGKRREVWARYADGALRALRESVARGNRDLVPLLEERFFSFRALPAYARVIALLENPVSKP